jgi:hypothetical protein
MFPQKKPSNALAAKMVGSEVPKPGHEDGTPKGLDRVVTVY